MGGEKAISRRRAAGPTTARGGASDLLTGLQQQSSSARWGGRDGPSCLAQWDLPTRRRRMRSASHRRRAGLPTRAASRCSGCDRVNSMAQEAITTIAAVRAQLDREANNQAPRYGTRAGRARSSRSTKPGTPATGSTRRAEEVEDNPSPEPAISEHQAVRLTDAAVGRMRSAKCSEPFASVRDTSRQEPAPSFPSDPCAPGAGANRTVREPEVERQGDLFR